MNEKQAVAILMANLKGDKKKVTNLVSVAEACRTLKGKWGLDEMTNFFRISSFTLRQIDKINDLNPDVRKLVAERKLGIEQAYQLSRLKGNRQSEAVREVTRLTAHETRTFVNLLLKNDSTPVQKCIGTFEKTYLKRPNLLVVPLSSNTYRRLQERASKSKITVHDVALRILEDYLDGR